MRRPPRPDRDPAGASRLLDEAAGHYHAGRLEAAAAAYRRAARADPGDFRAPYSLAVIELGRGRADRAAILLRGVVASQPAHFAAQHNLAAACQALELWDEAAAAYGRALALRPDAGETRRNLAAVLTLLGRTDEAVALYRTLAADPPTRLWALSRMAILQPGAIDADEATALRLAATDRSVDEDTRTALLFGLGGVLEHQNLYDDAFAAFAEGNRLKRAALVREAGPGASPADLLRAHAAAIERIKRRFTRDFIAARDAEGDPRTRPIFIVGMPRSGSTLIEQILASHPGVQALGETGDLPALLEDGAVLDGARSPAFRSIVGRFVQGLRDRGWRKDARPVDKTLENFLHVGAIALMFPNAVILHSVRDPVDTCLACFRQLFAGGAETLYDLGEIGAEYVAYRSMMDHWRHVLPGRVIDVSHEALVARPDAQIRWLVTEACGLTWDPRCLNFHETARAVTSASTAQVRQPIFRTSLQRGRRYEGRLGPLLDALGAYASPDFRAPEDR